MNRQIAVDIARTWLGTPYHHRAKVKGSGVDCGQILIAIFSEAKCIADFDSGDYPADWMMHKNQERYLSTVERYAKRAIRNPLPGDIALFRFGRCISHGALVTDWPQIIHAYKPAGYVIEDSVIANASLEKRFVGVWSVWD